MILGKSCKKYIVYHKPIDIFETSMSATQEIWIAENLEFSLEQEVKNVPYMLNLFSSGITLKLIENGDIKTYEGYAYERIAIDVSEMILDESIFNINEGDW